MANQFIQVPPNSTGLKLQTFENVVGANTVESEAVTLVRSSDNTEVGTSGQPLRIDPVGTTTQPVSGTVTANIGTSGSLALDASVTGLQVAQASTTAGQKGDLVQGAVTTAAPSYTTAQTSPISLNLSGGLRVDGSGVTQPVSGTVTANAGSGTFNIQSNASVNVTQIAGTAPTTVGKFDVKGADGDVFVRQATAANLNATVVGTGTFAVQATQSGTWTDRIVGNAGGAMDAATNASPPANALQAGVVSRSTLPTAASDGNLNAPLADTAGRMIVRSGGPRERLVVNTLTLSATTNTTLIAAGAANVFRDLTLCQASNTSSTNVRLDISDGTRTYSWFLAANGGGFNINFDPPLAATSSAVAWTAQLSAAVTDVRVGCQAVETK